MLGLSVSCAAGSLLILCSLPLLPTLVCVWNMLTLLQLPALTCVVDLQENGEEVFSWWQNETRDGGMKHEWSHASAAAAGACG